MRKHILVALLILSLLLTTTISRQVQAQEQEQYTLLLHGSTWNHSTISVLIVPSDNETWWNAAYINSTLRAIGQWNNAIADFSANYSEFEYLSKLRMIPTVSNETNSGFDVYIFWTETLARNATDEVGLATIFTNRFNTIVNCTINFAAKNQRGYTLSEVDVQNVALHELGHSLGIGHSNYTGDLMYPTYTLGSHVRAISNLNMHGVATVFQWIQNPSQLYPVSKWLKTSSVTMASDEYQYLPIAEENLPPPQPFLDPYLQPARTIIEYILEFVLRPEVLIPILTAIIALVVVILLIPSRKKTENGDQTVLRQSHEFYEIRKAPRLQSVV